MAVKILMPALSPTMTEAKLIKWLKKEGDEVNAGEVMFEIETDKATMEVEAVDEGILEKILVSDGVAGIKVNTAVAILRQGPEDSCLIEDVMQDNSTGVVTPTTSSTADKPVPADYSGVTDFSHDACSLSKSDKRVFITPLAKNMAKQHNLDINSIKGSGGNGRIRKNDVLACLDVGGAPQLGVVHANEVSGSTSLISQKVAVVSSISSMRRSIAARLLESKTTIPHFYLKISCNMTNLMKLRAEIALTSNAKISVNDFVVKAVAMALVKNPSINVQWTKDGILQHQSIDISVAVGLDDGLITPIVKNADSKGVQLISLEIKELIGKAKNKSLKLDEFQGGSMTVTNLGMYGVEDFIAIINPPQSCILAVGAVLKKPIVSEDGAIIIGEVMNVTLSCDHRVIDGVCGAKFLSSFKEYIEKPMLMLI